MSGDVMKQTGEIVTAYVGQNSVTIDEIPTLIDVVHGALASKHAQSESLASTPTPAVPINKSVRPDHLVCLENGRKLKMLKRHLDRKFNMTPDEYRAKWGLPDDYPMVAPDYSKVRSQLAKANGLGRKGHRMR